MLFIATSATVTYPSDLEGKNWFGIAGLPDSILRCDWVVRARLDYREGGERKGEGGGGGGGRDYEEGLGTEGRRRVLELIEVKKRHNAQLHDYSYYFQANFQHAIMLEKGCLLSSCSSCVC